MSTGPDLPRHHPDVEPTEDLAYEREMLQESIRHDYSTSDTGIVPLTRRRPLWHFGGLWITFAAGYSFLFLGFELHDGNSLARVVGITILGTAIYVTYAMFGAYLGSRTGQTHALLTRSIFGLAGSWIVSAFILVAPLGWVGFQAGLMADAWNGLYGWGHVELLAIIFAAVMIFNNLFGFTGISVFARYLVTPLIILWVVYMVIKGFAIDSDKLGGTPSGTGLPFWVAVTAVIGFSMWGNEPDVWRYGKPRFWWPLPTFIVAEAFLLLFTVGGWMMADLAGTSDVAPVTRFAVHYSLVGAFWLAFIIITLNQFAINDGNYYESINAGQNLIGAWSYWRRAYTCLIVAGGGALAAWLVYFKFTNGWFKVATFLAITVPCATVIMAVDHFLLPRMFRISRPLTRVPAWEETGAANWPAIVALLTAIFFGVTGTANWPEGWIYASPQNGWGPVPLESWAIAGIGYIVLVAIARVAVPNIRAVLGFSRPALAEAPPEGAIADIATLSGA